MDPTEARAASLVSYEQLHATLGGPADGEYMFDSVVEGSDGRLYGAMLNGGPEDGGLVFSLNKDGSNYVILHKFGFSPTNGLSPWGSVIEGSDGRLYGATRVGGASNAGTVFSLNKNGTGFAIVRSFTTNLNEGAFPMNSVIDAHDGMLYGRTCSGGTNNGNAIFRMNRDGTGYALLHSFTADLQFSFDSFSGLVEGSDGVLFGTTHNEGNHGRGAVFRMNKDGSGFQTLHHFSGTNDGEFPYGTVYETTEGVLYGATSEGGPEDYGTLYRINRDGTGYSVLRYFTPANSEGYGPVAPPVEGPGGLLYGTTYFGAVDDGGTIYVVKKDGSGFTFLREFLFNNVDGTAPNAPFIRGSDGALYGTTFSGGGPIYGTVFRVKPVALRGEQTPGGFAVHLEGFAGHRYGVESADSLPPTWTQVATLTNATGTVTWPDTAPPGNGRFYRARVLNP